MLIFVCLLQKDEIKIWLGKNTNIFSILNHALKLAEKIPKTNNKSFMISIDEIQEVLIDFEFIGIGKYVEDTNFTPYYRYVCFKKMQLKFDLS